MTQEPTKALELFYSYAHADERWRQRLETHLSNLKRRGFIVAWHDRNISAGTTWANEIDAHLNTADIGSVEVEINFSGKSPASIQKPFNVAGRNSRPGFPSDQSGGYVCLVVGVLVLKKIHREIAHWKH